MDKYVPWESLDTQNLELLDHVLDENDNFWVVNEINEKYGPLGYLLYEKVKNSDRYNTMMQKYYIRHLCKELIPIPISINAVFKPQKCLFYSKNILPKKWKGFVDVLNKIGIDDKDIGIFGSYLIGFEIKKDVDFVIYKLENLYKLYSNLDMVKSYLHATNISNKHILYQFNKHKSFYPIECDLEEIISRNLFGMQLENDILSTYRFIDINNTITPNIQNNKNEAIVGKVLQSITSSCLPRFVTLQVGEKIYKVYTSKWKFQSFARDNDILQLYGKVDHERKIITLNDSFSYIKILNKK